MQKLNLKPGYVYVDATKGKTRRLLYQGVEENQHTFILNPQTINGKLYTRGGKTTLTSTEAIKLEAETPYQYAYYLFSMRRQLFWVIQAVAEQFTEDKEDDLFEIVTNAHTVYKNDMQDAKQVVGEAQADEQRGN